MNIGADKARKKAFVGLSGGVDSAVSAALLQKEGYDVTGVFIKVWQPDWIECNWKEERLEAMRVAAHLGIPFVTLDLVKEYKQGVIDYMIAEYAAGRTPNPDVMCNREVKFGAFWQWAKGQGADFIATGHYARVGLSRQEETFSYPAGADRWSQSSDMKMSLLAGKDPNKDQSYFLWTLNQKDLEHVMFPVGGLLKSEVRKLAKKFKLPNADKKDSQGLCFIGKVDIKEFLAHYIKTSSGKVLNEKGEVIGEHPGALFFTMGERHGFTITKKSSGDKALYVISKDMGKNTITVSAREADTSTSEPRIGSQRLAPAGSRVERVSIASLNWSGIVPKANATVFVRTRYRQPLIKATIISIMHSEAEFNIENTTDPITPGQSLVVYKGEECLGGGIIQ